MIVLERGTGDLYFYDTLESAVVVAEEFADILDSEFSMFDESGQELRFLPSDVHVPPQVVDPTPSCKAELHRALTEFARAHRISWHPGEPLSICFRA